MKKIVALRISLYKPCTFTHGLSSLSLWGSVDGFKRQPHRFHAAATSWAVCCGHRYIPLWAFLKKKLSKSLRDRIRQRQNGHQIVLDHRLGSSATESYIELKRGVHRQVFEIYKVRTRRRIIGGDNDVNILSGMWSDNRTYNDSSDRHIEFLDSWHYSSELSLLHHGVALLILALNVRY